MIENYYNSCQLCYSEDLEKLDEYTKDHLVKCRNCGFVFSSRIATDEELAKFYSHYHINEPLSTVTNLRYNEWLNNFEKYRINNNLLDVGCGDGYFLLAAKSRGWNIYGTEYTQRQADVASSKGINMNMGTLDTNNYPVDFFDVITCVEVIEHLKNPNEEVQMFNKICRKGGVIYITTPNFDALSRHYFKNEWNIFAYPEHLAYYNKKTLTRLFEQNGFKTETFKTTGISLKRYRQSASGDKSTVFTVDETIRQKAEEKMIFRLVKKIINFFLTVTNKGDTLKGLFVKK